MSIAGFRLAPVETFDLASNYVDQTFRIQVALPLAAVEEIERYPTLFVTEANLTFDATRAIALSLHAASQLNRFILVGIGYPSDSPFASGVLRGRDLTPPNFPRIPGIRHRSLIEDVPGLGGGGKKFRGGSDFLDFVEQELVPVVDARFPTIEGDRGYFGHSLGARLGLHALLSRPGLFRRYLLSSPGLTWGDKEHGLEETRRRLSECGRLDAHVFMSIAENEEFEANMAESRMASSFYRLAGYLREIGLAGLDLTTRVFREETHASVWPIAFSHGVRCLYGTPHSSLMGTPVWASSVTPEGPG